MSVGYIFLPLVAVFGSFWTIFWLLISGLILYFVWTFVRESIPALKDIGPENISPLSVVLSILLILAINLLFSKIWIDLGQLSKNLDGIGLGLGYPLNMIFYHAIFVGVVSVLAVVLLMINKGTKIGLVVLPYFIVSLLFLIRVLFEICTFLVKEYENLGVYVVIVLVILILTILIFLIQKSYENFKKRENRIEDALRKESSVKKDSLPPV